MNIKELTDNSDHDWVLEMDDVKVMFDRVFIETNGTAHLYSDGTVICVVEGHAEEFDDLTIGLNE